MRDQLATYLTFGVIIALVATRGKELGKAIKAFAGGVGDVLGTLTQ